MKETIKHNNFIEGVDEKPEQEKNKKEVFVAQESEQSEVEFRQNILDSIEKESSRVMTAGIEEIDQISNSSELKPDEISSIQKELSLFSRLKNIQEEIFSLAQQTKEGLAQISQEKKQLVKPGEIFNPATELKKLHQLPKQERAQALKEFKQKLAYQKQGLAKIQEQIITAIRDNPDTSAGQLYEIMRDLGPKYGVTSEQKQAAKSILEAYAAKHKKVKEVRESFPDDRGLYFHLFGRPPKGRVEVVEGPITLYFRCHDISDYAYIYSQAFLQNRSLTPNDLAAANMSGGVSIRSSLRHGLEGAIIAENAQGRPFKGCAKGILIHEEQHAMKNFFQEEETKSTAFQELKIAKNKQEQEKLLKRHFRWLREREQSRAKDEILAFLKDGFHSPEQTLEYLTKPKQEGGLYDYFADQKEGLTEFFEERLGEELKPLIEKTFNKVFVNEYHQLLKDSIDSFVKLRRKGYSQEQTIAFLIKEPLSKWRKAVERQPEAR